VLWVALELPSLPLQLAERAGESAAPLVIAEGPVQRPLVTCANRTAKEAGIREGQAVASARALAGELKVLARDLDAEREALERLAAWAGQFTPMACLDGQGITLEVDSSVRLFGGHAKLTSAIRRGVKELGFHASFGVAPTALAARVLARAGSRGAAARGCLALADLHERIAELPIFLLEWPEKSLARLTDLGLVRLKDLLAIPAEGLARRFGPEIALDLERLMGRVADPRLPYVPPPTFRAKLELPAEAEGVEALLFPLRRLLAEFEGALRGRGSGVQQLSLSLFHVRRARTHVALEFASPEREADFILAIAREKLSRLTLVAPTHAIELRAEALLPYSPRPSAWLPGPKEQAIGRERLVERLSARLGAEKVFALEVGDDHRPERAWRRGAVSHATPGPSRVLSQAKIARPSPNRPAWLLQRPHRLVSHDGKPSLQGDLTLAAGPERIEAGWWDGEEVRRDYYVATNARGECYWIYREHRDPTAWYLHGVFA
jgi:protein ImuB